MTAATFSPPPVGRQRRWTELAMLLFAMSVVVAAYIAVGFAEGAPIPEPTIKYAGGLAVLFGVAHLAIRRFAPYADPLLLPAVAMLNGLGLVLIHRLDLAEADKARAAGRAVASGDAGAQMLWTALGVIGFVITLIVIRDHRILQRYTYTAAAVGLVLLMIPAILPAQYSMVNGARIWIRVAGFSIQPSEIAKLLLEIFFAGYLVSKRELLALTGRRFLGFDFPRGRDLGPILVAWLASLVVLVFERDLGTSLLFFGIFIAMLYVATERTSWLVLGLTMFLGGAFVAHGLFSHVQTRVSIWLDPFADANGGGYQLVQALFGMADGGVAGTGLGQGRPETVPFAKSDFITATIGEELGLAGLMAVLVLFFLVVERGLRAALSVRDSFGKLLAAGLAFGFALQIFVVVGGVTKLIPLTGLTLPFLSYGGSSLIANWTLIALLLRISDASRRPVSEPPAPPPPVRPGDVPAGALS